MDVIGLLNCPKTKCPITNCAITTWQKSVFKPNSIEEIVFFMINRNIDNQCIALLCSSIAINFTWIQAVLSIEPIQKRKRVKTEGRLGTCFTTSHDLCSSKHNRMLSIGLQSISLNGQNTIELSSISKRSIATMAL